MPPLSAGRDDQDHGKNYFAAIEYRLAAALGLGIGGPLLWGVAIVGPFTGTVAGLAAGLAMLSLMLPAGILARRLGWSFGGAMLTPFMYPVLLEFDAGSESLV